MRLTCTLLCTLPTLLMLACGGSSGSTMTNSGSGASTGGSESPGSDSGDTSTTIEPTGSGSHSGPGTGTPDLTTSTTDLSTSTTSTTDEGTSTTGAPISGTTTDESTSTGTSTTIDESTSTSSTTEIEDCATWQPLFAAEVQKIRGCDTDAECGVELVGTSCGCTRNWVARLDADLKEFDALVAKANELGCDLPFISTCDCPNADGFACVNNTCTWNYL